jgi:GNAT superfamily N-acetyltransferase
MPTLDTLRIVPAGPADVPVILGLIRAMADYEHLSHEVKATEDTLRDSLFGDRSVAEVAVAWIETEPVGYAAWFHNYSTFLGRPGLYLEDVFVVPSWRRHGIGRRLLAHVAKIAVERQCGRMEWAVLKWNALAIRVYQQAGAQPLDDWMLYRLTGDSLARLAAEAH